MPLSPRTPARLALAVLAGLCLTSALDAQAPPAVPKVLQVTPAGGQAGTSFEVTVVGQDLLGAEGLHFSFPGAKAEPIGAGKPLSPAEMTKGGKPAPPATSQRFRVTLPDDAPFGAHDVRVVARGGISNPRAFVVGDQKEALEKEPNDDQPKAQRVVLNSVVHGVINTPTDVDYYAFVGKKGQRVFCVCLTSSIDSKLPAAVEMYSAGGSSFGQGRNYQGGDALLDVTLPADGDYFVRVSSFSYSQGGPDHFYRLALTQAPWIDAVFPPAVEPGKEAEVTLYGRNLPGGAPDPAAVVDGRTLDKLVVTVKAPAGPAAQRLNWDGHVEPFASALDGFAHRVKNEHGASNVARLTFARAPVVLDNGKNDTREQAQPVDVPCEIAGRIEKKGDRDWYSFTAKKGQALVIEAFGERLGAPLDLVLTLHNAKGDPITEQDDFNETLSPQFLTRSDDPPPYRFTPPADGTYYLLVASRDSFTQAGPRHVYTVRIAPEEPDFRLVAMPPSPTAPDAPQLGQAGGVALPVYVWRLGGFAGDITVTGEDLPPGVSVPRQVLAGGQKQGVLVLTAAPDAEPFAGSVRLVGTATFKGRKLVREVRSATITWPVPQANQPTLTRLDRERVLAVRGKAPYLLAATAEKVTAVPGGKATIPVKLQAREYKGNVQVTALGLPPGAKGQPLSLSAGKEGNLVFDVPTNFPPGTYSVVLRGQTQPANPNQPPPKGAPANLVQASAPVFLTVIPKQLAKVTVNPAPAKLRLGKEVEVTVQAARQFEMPIAFKVEVVFPGGAKGLSAEPVTIEPDASEARVTIRAAPDAGVGTQSVTVRATALFEGNVPVVHEAKLQLNVTK